MDPASNTILRLGVLVKRREAAEGEDVDEARPSPMVPEARSVRSTPNPITVVRLRTRFREGDKYEPNAEEVLREFLRLRHWMKDIHLWPADDTFNAIVQIIYDSPNVNDTHDFIRLYRQDLASQPPSVFNFLKLLRYLNSYSLCNAHEEWIQFVNFVNNDCDD